MAGQVQRVRVTGKVQGVWFRGWTQERAAALGLDGWVRNESDGSVAALLAGPPEAVARMIDALQDGPTLARVDRVERLEAEDPAPGPGFHILR